MVLASPNTISTWCRKDVVGGDKNYNAQINQLKRELDNAYRVIGKLSARARSPKRLAALEEVEPVCMTSEPNSR
jgi:hypothetical protein